jgi:hypothetical protein
MQAASSEPKPSKPDKLGRLVYGTLGALAGGVIGGALMLVVLFIPIFVFGDRGPDDPLKILANAVFGVLFFGGALAGAYLGMKIGATFADTLSQSRGQSPRP